MNFRETRKRERVERERVGIERKGKRKFSKRETVSPRRDDNKVCFLVNENDNSQNFLFLPIFPS